MNVEPATAKDVETLKTWFVDKESAFQWGGPGLTYPFTSASFLKDIHWGAMPAYVLRDERDTLLAFGQYYQKFGRCHLARLAVSPGRRKEGVGAGFIARLLTIGLADLSLCECSLFVISDNVAAINCYKRLGFVAAPWPTQMNSERGIVFMVRHKPLDD